MKNKKIMIFAIVVILLIVVLWLGGIIPKQIAKIYGAQYMNKHFPKMQLEYDNIEWNEYFGDYIITFKDKENKTHGCVIGPKYFPINMGQGMVEIRETYMENYK
ncbi:MAG: hypothetical protein IJW20_06000 [Clostridia bacterium]|nr:hypothetical protein [Clostridia bacterium]